MSTTETTETPTVTEPIVVGSRTGQIKAFNAKKGYGFITVHGEDNMDVFVHQTNIFPLCSTYRTLTRGEYVSFDISDDEKKQALNVRGVGGGTLRCDAVSTRRPRDEDGGDEASGEFTVVNRQRSGGRGGRGRGGGRGGRGGSRPPRVQNANGDAPSSATLADFVPRDAEVAVETPAE
jgi:cold shock protein